MSSVWCTFCSTRKMVTPPAWIRFSTAKVSCTQRGGSPARRAATTNKRGWGERGGGRRGKEGAGWGPRPRRERPRRLPAPGLGAGGSRPPLRELRKGLEDPIEPLADDLGPAVIVCGDHQVLQYREAREDP